MIYTQTYIAYLNISLQKLVYIYFIFYIPYNYLSDGC